MSLRGKCPRIDYPGGQHRSTQTGLLIHSLHPILQSCLVLCILWSDSWIHVIVAFCWDLVLAFRWNQIMRTCTKHDWMLQNKTWKAWFVARLTLGDGGWPWVTEAHPGWQRLTLGDGGWPWVTEADPRWWRLTQGDGGWPSVTEQQRWRGAPNILYINAGWNHAPHTLS